MAGTWVGEASQRLRLRWTHGNLHLDPHGLFCRIPQGKGSLTAVGVLRVLRGSTGGIWDLGALQVT